MPRRPEHSTAESFGTDSFLDVVSNIVGILIILVMVVGVRVKENASARAAASVVSPVLPTAELEAAAAEDLSLQQENRRLSSQIQVLQNESLARSQERLFLATMLTDGEGQLETRRRQLDEQARQAVDLQRQLPTEAARLAAMEQELARREQVMPSRTITLESYPTPLGKMVHGQERHFQLKDGRLAWIPLDDLLEKFKTEVDNQIWKLRSRRELADAVGPVEGFRLRYLIKRVDAVQPDSSTSGMATTGSYAKLVEWRLIPTSSDLGERVEDALSDGSRFEQLLSRWDARRVTITFWTYPDGFEDFRRLKKLLHERGFTVAGRPLPEGMPISGSPQGRATTSH